MIKFLTAMSLGLLLNTAVREGLAASVDDVIADATAKSAGYQTWTADYLQSMDLLGSQMNIRGQIMRKGPRQMRVEMELPMMGQTAEMLMVTGSDGILWQEMTAAGQLRVMKTDTHKMAGMAGQMGLNADPLRGMDPAKHWEQSQQIMDLTLLPAAEVHGQPMHVIQGIWKAAALTNQQIAAAARFFSTTRMYVGKEDGFLHKTEMLDRSGSNVVMSMEFRNLKFNEPLSDEIFQYQPPKGVTVMDLTELAAPAAPATQ